MAIYQLRTNRSRLGELSVTLIFQLYYQLSFHGLLALFFFVSLYSAGIDHKRSKRLFHPKYSNVFFPFLNSLNFDL